MLKKKKNLKKWPTEMNGLFEYSEEAGKALDFLPEHLLLNALKDLSPIKLTRENLRIVITNLFFKSETELKRMIADKETTPVYFRLIAATIAASAAGNITATDWLVKNAIGESKEPQSKSKDDNTIIVLKDPSNWSDEEIIEKQKKLIQKNIKAYENT